MIFEVNKEFVENLSLHNAVCRCLYRVCCYFNMYKTNQLTGNVYNDSEETIKVKEDIRSCYAKYVFLLGKIYKQSDREPSPFGPFY